LFDHAETVSAGSLDRIAALGGAVSVQNRMSFQGGAFLARYGAAAAGRTPPVRAMLDRGLTVAAGTDATRVSSYNPWVSLHWLVTGRTVGGTPLRPGPELLGRETALALYTRGGARLTGEEDVKGVLREGFYGDLTVLSDDYFTVPDAAIPDIESVLTVVGGRIVYATAEYEGLDEALPPIAPEWSPVARFGGYGAGGARQAELMAQAVAESEAHRRWRAARGSAPGAPQPFVDPCLTH
ncbi:amidohydrolase family protein, partial [Streptomyces sp. NPDC006324]